LKVTTLTDKNGHPMAFVDVDFHDKVESIVVFHKTFAELKHMLVAGKVYGWSCEPNTGALARLWDIDDVSNYVVDIPDDKSDEFLSFRPSCEGKPNIRVDGFDIGCVKMDMEMLDFIEENFGITNISYAKYK